MPHLMQKTPPGFGEPFPFFSARTDGIDNYSLEVAAGRWIVLMVFGSLGLDEARAAHDQVLNRRGLFNDTDAAFFGVSIDAGDRESRGLSNAAFGLRYFWDFDGRICRLLGLVAADALQPTMFLIDRSFRVALSRPLAAANDILDHLELALNAERAILNTPAAPVLTLERIFESEFCRDLVRHFQSSEPTESGFAADVGGRTVTVTNPAFKRRQDVTVTNGELVDALTRRLHSRLFPMVRRAFGWLPTEIERFLIVRYGSDDQGFFSAHRDDATPGTAHRKFAVTINLNDDFEGGTLRFPEFGRALYKPPAGGAVVFSCSVLHEALPVTGGTRYAFVPFLNNRADSPRRHVKSRRHPSA